MEKFETILDKNYSKEENEQFHEKLNYEINKTKSKVENILDENFALIEELKSKWIKDNLDLLLLPREEVFDLASENQFVLKHFKNKDNFTKEKIIRFLLKNWLKRISLEEQKAEVFDFFRENWVNYTNELIYGKMWKLVKKIQENKRVAYFFQKNWVNWKYVNFSIENITKILEKYNFPKMWKIELQKEVLKFLDENGVNSSKKTFRKAKSLFSKLRENPLLYSYFYNSWVRTSSSYKDFYKILQNLLEDKNINIIQNVKNFLRENGIYDYETLKSFWKTREIRKLLWSNREIQEIFFDIWVKYAREFREEDIKKFARRIGFSDIPEVKVFDESETKEFLKNILKKNGIEDLFSLEHFGLKKITREVLAEKTLGKSYERFNEFVVKTTWKTISNMALEDLRTFWEKLWFTKFSEEEQKQRVLEFFELNGLNFEKLTTSNFRKQVWIWENPSVYYFIQKLTGKTRKNMFITEDLEKFREYFTK